MGNSLLLVDLLLGDDVVEGLIGFKLHPRDVGVLRELCTHFLYLGVLVLSPRVFLSQVSGESIKLLRLKRNTYHQDFVIV